MNKHVSVDPSNPALRGGKVEDWLDDVENQYDGVKTDEKYISEALSAYDSLTGRFGPEVAELFVDFFFRKGDYNFEDGEYSLMTDSRYDRVVDHLNDQGLIEETGFTPRGAALARNMESYWSKEADNLNKNPELVAEKLAEKVAEGYEISKAEVEEDLVESLAGTNVEKDIVVYESLSRMANIFNSIDEKKYTTLINTPSESLGEEYFPNWPDQGTYVGKPYDGILDAVHETASDLKAIDVAEAISKVRNRGLEDLGVDLEVQFSSEFIQRCDELGVDLTPPN